VQSSEQARTAGAENQDVGLQPAQAKPLPYVRAESNAKRTSHLDYRVKARLSAWSKSFVQTLSSEAGVFRHLRHAPRTRHICEGNQQKIRIICFEHSRHVLRNCSVIVETTCCVEWKKLLGSSRFAHSSNSSPYDSLSSLDISLLRRLIPTSKHYDEQSAFAGDHSTHQANLGTPVFGELCT